MNIEKDRLTLEDEALHLFSQMSLRDKERVFENVIFLLSFDNLKELVRKETSYREVIS